MAGQEKTAEEKTTFPLGYFDGRQLAAEAAIRLLIENMGGEAAKGAQK